MPEPVEDEIEPLEEDPESGVLYGGVEAWFETFRTDSWDFTTFRSDWQDVVFRPFELPAAAGRDRGPFRDVPRV